MARFKILRWTVLGTVLLGLTACKKNDDPTPGPNDTKRRTVLTYMVADNNLYSFAERDINEMEAGWSARFDGRLVVFLYPVAETSGYAPRRTDYDEDPRLLLIERDERTDVISSRVLKRYDRTMDPTDPATMRRVIDEVMQLAPAESYGLVLWSHGSGWLTQGLSRPLRGVASPLLSVADEPGAALPSETTAPEDGVTAYSFGASDSHGGEMEVDELARALPTETTFDFILFDACHMAGIEVAWELRERTEYLIASAAETLANGFPYEAILGPMFEATADVKAIAREFYDYYNSQSGSFQSATVGVIRCNRLPEVAAAMRSLCESGLPAGGSPMRDSSTDVRRWISTTRFTTCRTSFDGRGGRSIRPVSHASTRPWTRRSSTRRRLRGFSKTKGGDPHTHALRGFVLPAESVATADAGGLPESLRVEHGLRNGLFVTVGRGAGPA